MRQSLVPFLAILGAAPALAHETRIASRDSFLTQGSANKNEGANPILRIQSSGSNRAVLGFDLSGVSLAGLEQATLVLTISSNAENWGPSGRPVRAHRLLTTFAEGNGWNVGGSIRGTGAGVTWNCAADANIANQSPDCASGWNGGSFAAATSPAVVVSNGMTGELSFDVTADVTALGGSAPEVSFLVKKEDGSQSGQVEFFSKEAAAAAGNMNLAPRLVLVTAALNQPPVAESDAALTARNRAVFVDVLANDADANNDSLSIVSVSNPPHGTAVIGSGKILYTPDADFLGTDAFTYTIQDHAQAQSTAAVSILVGEPALTTLSVVKDAYLRKWAPNTNEGGSTFLRVRDLGDNAALVAFDLSGQDLSGLLTATLSLTIQETSNYWGSGRLLRAHRLLSEWTEGNGFHSGGNVPGTGAGVTWNCATDLDLSDHNPDCLVLWDGGSYAAPTSPGFLVTNGMTGEVAFDVTHDVKAGAAFGWVVRKEDESAPGRIEFESRESDPSLGARLVLERIAVGNLAPVAANDSAETLEETAVSIEVLANDFDPDGDALAVTGVTDPANGAAILDSYQRISYTPDAGFTGTDTFSYTIEDGDGGSDTATVTVEVLSAPPVARDDAVPEAVAAGSFVLLDVLSNDTGGGLSITEVGTPSLGAAEIEPGAQRVRYTAGAGVSGPDSFSYTVTDAIGRTATATVSLTVVAPANLPPLAVPDSATTFETLAASIAVLSNDVDPDADSLVLQSVGAAANGSTSIEPDGVLYAPNPGFTGTDTFSYTISDGRGGIASGAVRVTVLSDEAPPTIQATVAPVANAGGWHSSDVTVSFMCMDAESGIASCPAPVTLVEEGASQERTEEAFDRAGNRASRTVRASVDKTAPSVEISGPSSGRPGETLRIAASASDNLALERVNFQAGGVPIQELKKPPFEASFTIPAGAVAGSVVTIDAVAMDRAGNQATASPLLVQVLGGGFVQGEVYDDRRGTPLSGVSIAVNDSSIGVSDFLGRFGAPSSAATAVVRLQKEGFTAQERVVAVRSLTGTLVLDGRLTPLDPVGFVSVDGSGGLVSAEALTLTVPSGALAVPTALRLTRISGQGLRTPLPLGWSPAGSAELEPEGVVFAVPASLRLEREDLEGVELVLARYDEVRNTWVAEATGLTGGGFVEATLERSGAYAFVAADVGATAPEPAAEGEALPSVEAVEVDAGLTATAEVTPEASPVDPDAAAIGSVLVSSLVPLPSGSLVSARVEEAFDTFDAGEIRPEPFVQEIVLYRFPPVENESLHAEFPVTPTRSFTLEELREGRVHVDIQVSPRFDRGSLVSPQGFTVRGEEGVELVVPAGAVTDAIAAYVRRISPEDAGLAFVGLTLLGGAGVDLGGTSLALPASLSVPGAPSSPENLFAARFLYVQGQRKLRLLGRATYDDGRVSVSAIHSGGTYFFFQSESPLALVEGIVSEGGGPAPFVIVESSTAPFMDVTPADGTYRVAAKLQTTALTARSLQTGNQASVEVAPATSETVSLDLTLAAMGPFVTQAVPENGALGVALAPAITVTFSEPVAPSTVTPSSFTLVKTSDGSPIAGRVVLGAGNRSASFLQQENLEPEASYTAALTSSVTDPEGNALLPFSWSFTTLEDEAAGFDPDAVQVSFPDGNGEVTVSAPAGSFESGASVLIVNDTQSIVVSGVVDSDGSFSFTLRAAITDELQIRIRDSSDREVVIGKTEYVAEDGRVAIGALGGSVRAMGDLGEIALSVPEGALEAASIFRLTPIPQADVAQLPLARGVQAFGAAVELDTGGATLKKEAELTLPLPPGFEPDAAYAVLGKIEENGVALYEVIDSASVKDGKLVTDSYPFVGLVRPLVYLSAWSLPQPTPGRSPLGVITGVARETDNDAAEPESKALSGVRVRVDRPGGPEEGDYVATSDENGRFVLYDDAFGVTGTSATVVGKDRLGREQTAVAFHDSRLTEKFPLLDRYARSAAVFLNFPVSEPPPPPAGVAIRFYSTSSAFETEITSGFAPLGQEVLIRAIFEQIPSSPSASIGGFEFPLVTKSPLEYEVRFTPTEVRAYAVTVRAFDAFLREFGETRSFLAVVVGDENNNVPREGPPSVLTGSSLPRPGDGGVSPTSALRVFFSEPVRGVSTASVRLVEVNRGPDGEAQDGAAVELSILGSTPEGAILLAVEPADTVTTLTLRPKRGLEFGREYKLVLDEPIVDTNTPTALPLEPSPTVVDFKTFSPKVLGQVPVEEETLGQVDLAVLRDRAFVATQAAGGSLGTLLAYDIRDPAKPVRLVGVEDSTFVGSMVWDVKAAASFDLGVGEPMDLVGVLSFNPFTINTNLTLFNVGETRLPPYRYDAVVTTAVEGEFSASFDLFDGFAYVASGTRGLQVIDLERAARKLELESPEPFRFDAEVSRQLYLRNGGYARDTISHTIPIRPAGANLSAVSVAVAETSLGNVAFVGSWAASELAKLSSLRVPQNLPDPSLQHLTLVKDGVGLSQPTFVRLTRIDGRAYAIVAGGTRVAVVDVDDPTQMTVVSILELQGPSIGGLALASGGAMILVATSRGVETYNLSDPENPTFGGLIEGLTLVSGDADVSGNLLLTVDRATGLKVSALDAVPLLQTDPALLVTDGALRVLHPGRFLASVVPGTFEVRSAELELIAGPNVFSRTPLGFSEGRGQLPFGAGTGFPFVPEGSTPTPDDGADPELEANRETGPRMRLMVNRETPLEKRTPILPIQVKPLLFGVSESVTVRLALDPVNEQVCLAAAQPIAYGLGLTARVTLSVILDGAERVVFSAVQSPENGEPGGFFTFAINDLNVLPRRSGFHEFRVVAELPQDPTARMEVRGALIVDADAHGVLPVGHTFVKGVDLVDGHLVSSSSDLRVPGRIPLEVTRSYSNAGVVPEGAMGAGWSHNYLSRVQASSCAVQVVGADGTAQSFVRVGDRFEPQKGYHTRLVLNADGSYDFFTKGGIRYHYKTAAASVGVGATGGESVLDFIEDPNGNRVRAIYDGSGLLTEVREELGPNDFGRSITFEYTAESIFGERRVARIRGPLGFLVEYGYDAIGNLTEVRRAAGSDDESVERYEYGLPDLFVRHNLTARNDPNGNRTEYLYYEDGDGFAGETPGSEVVGKTKYVKEVREPEGVVTSFAYDVSESALLRYTTRVTDGRGLLTRYTLNGNGSPLEIQEPAVNGETALTVMEWSATDIVKTREVDALGRETLFEYDERGNLTKERVRAQLPDADGNLVSTDVVTEFRYDPTYNKMTYKKDAEGRETHFEIDPSNGNLLSVRDAEGNATRFLYGANGDLEATLGPRPEQETRVSYDRNGNPETTTDALGNVTAAEYDERSRLLSQTDTFGRSRTQEFDQLDRVKRTVRTDGKGSSDEETIERTYYDGGEVLTERNGLGLLRTFELDGLNRVVRAEESTGSETLVATMSYDENGNVVEKTDRRGVASFLTYDARNRLTRVEVDGPFGPRKTVSTMGYDRVGNKLFETDVQGNRTEMEYDGLYRVVRRRLPTLHEEEFRYDRVGNKILEEDANRNETRFEYDSLNRLIRRTDAVGNVTELDHDESGNQTLERDVTRGMRVETDYDALNRPMERRVTGSDPNGFTYETTWVYDDSAHTVEETDPRGFRKRTELDGFDRVHRVSQETGEEVLETTSFYDGNGNLSRTRDGEGRETEFEYDGWNRLREIRHPLGLETRFDYDGEGNKTREVNRRSIETRFAYDDLGRLVKTELDEVFTNGGATLVTSEIAYLDPERKRVEKDARGNETTYELDGQGRVLRITDPEGEEQRFEYDGVNKRAEVDKRSERTELEYDGVNRVTKVTDALSQEIVTVYDDAARTVTETDKRSLVKTMELDALGRLVSVTRSGALLEEHAYDGNSNQVLSTDANGNPTRFEYDGANRLTGRTDAAGTMTRFTYDRVGNLLTEKDGRVTGKPFDVRNVYDDLNRLESTEDAEGNVTTYEYDGEGNRTAVVEAKGSEYRTEYDYGELNELLQVRMPDGGVYRYDYDEARNRTRQTDGEGNVVSFNYDRLNRLDVMVQDPGGFNYTTDHDYDPNGNEIRLTDPKGQVIDFEYDELNRLKSKVYNLTAADLALYTRTHRIDYGYDENDNLVRIDETKSSGTDPPAVVSSLKTYDDLDRLETETDAWGRRLTYDYDTQGNRTLLIDPDSVRTEYSYDELNRLETLTFNDGQTVRYEYFPDGLKKKVTNPNGTVSSYAYDAADRMTEISHVGPTGLVSAYEYTYDPNSNRERQVEQNAGRTETTEYTYDFVNRLKTVTYPDRTVAYEYDLAGNRTRELTTGAEASDETFHYDAINRLERITNTATTAVLTSYVYDANGNTTSKTKGGVATTFHYDIRDQLGEVRQGASILGRYGYDYDGRRILKIGDDGRRQYTYDQLSVITEADQVNATVSKYDYGMDQLVRLDNRGEGRSFFHLDGLRSTVSLTDGVGESRQSIFYDAWGNERDRIGSSANNFTFTGHELDEETGLIYARSRFYDSDIGRFLTQDSFFGDVGQPPSLNRFSYALANPLRFFDLTGRSSEPAGVNEQDLQLALGMVHLQQERQRAEEEKLHSRQPHVVAEQIGSGMARGLLVELPTKTWQGLQFPYRLLALQGAANQPDWMFEQRKARGFKGQEVFGVELPTLMAPISPEEARKQIADILPSTGNALSEQVELTAVGVSSPSEVVDAMKAVGVEKSMAILSESTVEGVLIGEAAGVRGLGRLAGGEAAAAAAVETIDTQLPTALGSATRSNLTRYHHLAYVEAVTARAGRFAVNRARASGLTGRAAGVQAEAVFENYAYQVQQRLMAAESPYRITLQPAGDVTTGARVSARTQSSFVGRWTAGSKRLDYGLYSKFQGRANTAPILSGGDFTITPGGALGIPGEYVTAFPGARIYGIDPRSIVPQTRVK